jgi:hypothetical protein
MGATEILGNPTVKRLEGVKDNADAKQTAKHIHARTGKDGPELREEACYDCR